MATPGTLPLQPIKGVKSHMPKRLKYPIKPKLQSSTGRYSRGYLPHIDGKERQFITYRLCDSVPLNVIRQWEEELSRLRDEVEILEKIALIQKYLDLGKGACWMRDERIADLVQNSLWHDREIKYTLDAWCVMPNHVHALITLTDPYLYDLENITQGWKSTSAHRANKLLGRRGRFWMPESFDRYIRNDEHFSTVTRYIENNPVKAGLCQRPEDWRWSSAHWRNREIPYPLKH